MAKSFDVYDKNFNLVDSAGATIAITDTLGDICFLGARNDSIFFASASTTELVLYQRRPRESGLKRVKVLWTPGAGVEGRGVCSIGKHLILVTRDTGAATGQHRGIHMVSGAELWSSGKGAVELYGICWDGRFVHNCIDLATDQFRTYWVSGKSSTLVDNHVLGGVNGHRAMCFDGKTFWLAPQSGLTFKQIDRLGRPLKISGGTTYPNYTGIMTDGKLLYCAAAA